MSEFHRAEHAEERGEGICRTCLAPIWNEGGTIDHQRRDAGWSDRGRRDSIVCFKAVEYRHVPLTGREACIYDRAYQRAQRRDDVKPTAALERLLAKHQLADILPGGALCTCGAELAALNPPLDDGAVKGEPLALAVHQLQELEAVDE